MRKSWSDSELDKHKCCRQNETFELKSTCNNLKVITSKIDNLSQKLDRITITRRSENLDVTVQKVDKFTQTPYWTLENPLPQVIAQQSPYQKILRYPRINLAGGFRQHFVPGKARFQQRHRGYLRPNFGQRFFGYPNQPHQQFWSTPEESFAQVPLTEEPIQNFQAKEFQIRRSHRYRFYGRRRKGQLWALPSWKF